MRKTLLGVTLAMTLVLGGCGYNTFQTTDEQVKASWSEVINQYQRRADLVPNLVNTVKGEAKFEQDTLTQVVEARAKATSIQATPGKLSPSFELRSPLVNCGRYKAVGGSAERPRTI